MQWIQSLLLVIWLFIQKNCMTSCILVNCWLFQFLFVPASLLLVCFQYTTKYWHYFQKSTYTINFAYLYHGKSSQELNKYHILFILFFSFICNFVIIVSNCSCIPNGLKLNLHWILTRFLHGLDFYWTTTNLSWTTTFYWNTSGDILLELQQIQEINLTLSLQS